MYGSKNFMLVIPAAQVPLVMNRLYRKSQAFSIVPFPDDFYEVSVRKENAELLKSIIAEDAERQKWVALAQEDGRVDDDLEVDSDAVHSPGDDSGGAFVSAWLWIPKPEKNGCDVCGDERHDTADCPTNRVG